MEQQIVIVAGATGLVGTELTKLLLEERAIDHIYALSRKPLAFTHPKLETILDHQLRVLEWDESKVSPSKGYICLGTTRKQAGSMQGLEDIDYHLVCQVAKTMKLLGVKHLSVVSSLGANPRSPSHYLRCKGKMEQALEQLGFDSVTFVRPGPLVGLRDNPRTDEAIVQWLFKIIRPLMVGSLARYIPIPAALVAKSMLYDSFSSHTRSIQRLDSVEMRKLLNKYR
ncbi:NAD(P)H-binding protein [Vibrio panuliri]|uniref:Nucleoside-diphosphate sugar epimerase n=1 Tax=Vibrio panuliri TaxID=1381081 RepID=A0ABX3FDH7_9VIBR|nr:NAD(P)H-binding protein [Vibrio panuliri]KAB1454481.1 NAD(P)H-binding protein [Vibrio panuliri]OLQ90019.1 nucleoside-diphosphate sugar epimerase [Vibrio panuliri]